MIELLNHLEIWMNSKSNIFRSENYQVSISDVFNHSKKFRSLSIDTDKIIAQANLWDSGEIEFQINEIGTEKVILLQAEAVTEVWQLDDRLNWWLSEVATYVPEQT